jgi:Fe-S-cluster containining protein
MPSSNEISDKGRSNDYPGDWDEEKLRGGWIEHLQKLMNESGGSIPLKRIQFQVEQGTNYTAILKRWSWMSGPDRVNAWKRLLESSEQAIKEVLPTCVQCGECCRKGSPTLMLEDLDILRQEKIPWNQLYSLRRGEPVRSPFEEKLFFLLDERIKLREKPGTKECILFDDSTDTCTVYADRPLQCRAQACWDPTEAKQVAEQSYLTRRDIFKGIELLLDLLAEHDRRCSFDKMSDAFKRLEESKGETVEEVIELLAYEDHFRHFLGEQLNIPIDTLDLLFGRSFADMVSLVGFQVREKPDGTRCLVPDQA